MPSRAGRHCSQPGCSAVVAGQRYCRDHGQTRVHLVIGPPCSGKSTFVAENAQAGDLVVDWDALAAAASGAARVHGHTDRWPQLFGYVAAARDALLSRLAQRRTGAEPAAAWVISTNMITIGDLQPKVHVMDTPTGECVRRLHADPDGRDVAEVERVIRAWRSTYRP